MTGRLDWCCIGAQKAGTSTLYRLLRDHPQLAIPPGKEHPIFDREVTRDEVRDYLDSRFGAAGHARCGTVTPQYLSAPDTAARLHEHAPDTKIVVLLRDPVARAVSHFKMSTLRGLETRDFDTAALAQLAAAPDDLYSEVDTYVVRGNYAWMLEGWLARFAAVHVVFTADLDRDPAATVRGVQRFLDVDERDPDDTDFRFNASPAPHRLSALRRPVAKGLRRVGWDRVPPERRERVSSAVERTLARALRVERRELRVDTERALRDHYAADTTRLRELIGAVPPWVSTPAARP